MARTPIDELLDSEDDSPSAPDIKPQRCSICSMFEDRGKLKPVEMDSEKLILIVGFVLNQKMTIVRAKELLSKKRGVLSCVHHFSDVFHDIRKSMNLSCGERIRAVSGDKIKNLMRVVHSVRPEIKASNFLVLFELCGVLNKHRINNLPPIEIKLEEPPPPVLVPICPFCSNPCEDPRELSQDCSRLIIAVSWVLAKKWTHEKALEILKSPQKLMACHSHFLETLDLIFDSLGIENENVDLVNEANFLVQVLMRIVGVLRPGTSCAEFVKCFRQFYALNRDTLLNVKIEPE